MTEVKPEIISQKIQYNVEDATSEIASKYLKPNLTDKEKETGLSEVFDKLKNSDENFFELYKNQKEEKYKDLYKKVVGTILYNAMLEAGEEARMALESQNLKEIGAFLPSNLSKSILWEIVENTEEQVSNPLPLRRAQGYSPLTEGERKPNVDREAKVKKEKDVLHKLPRINVIVVTPDNEVHNEYFTRGYLNNGNIVVEKKNWNGEVSQMSLPRKIFDKTNPNFFKKLKEDNSKK